MVLLLLCDFVSLLSVLLNAEHYKMCKMHILLEWPNFFVKMVQFFFVLENGAVL